MSADWKEQLQRIIELSRERIRRLEAGANGSVTSTKLATNAPADAPSLRVDAIRQIEAEEKNIARLQRTIDALI